MRLPYQIFISLRYLRSKRQNKSVSFGTLVSIGGVAIGVMALLTVLSVMSGFHEDLQKKILGANAHIIVMSYKGEIKDYKHLMENINKEPLVISSSPFIMGQSMLTSGNKAHGVFIRGVEPTDEVKTTNILSNLKSNKGIEHLRADKVHWMIIGNELAQILMVNIGDVINGILPTGEIGPLGFLPKTVQFKVVDIFEIGMFEYDANLAIIDIKLAQDFFGYTNGSVSGIEVKISDIYKTRMITENINKNIGFPYYAKDWMQMNKNLFSALKLEKFVMFIILVLIILVASFNIISTLMMNVIEKSREIAILKSMGATDTDIMYIFMLQGLLIGIIGTLIGIISGYGLCYILDTYEIIKLPPELYYLSRLPVNVKFFDFLIVSISSVLISFISTIYPSYRASKLNPIEPLRYE